MKKEEYFERAITWVKRRGFSTIRANHEEFDQPAHFTKPNEEEPYVPDITGLRTGGKSYFEIATKPDDLNRRVSKWKLLATMAGAKGGKLFLLAPRGFKAFAEKVVKSHNLNAKVVYLN